LGSAEATRRWSRFAAAAAKVGVLAERYDVDPERDFTELRRYARNHNLPLTELARNVISSTAQLTDIIRST
jgi:AmiR/NasT family two-component response regulator